MRSLFSALLFLFVASCGPKPWPPITGPVPSESEWQFENTNKLKLKNANDDKTDANGYIDYGPRYIEIEKLPDGKPAKYREIYDKSDMFDAQIAEGDIWFKSSANSNQFSYAVRMTSYNTKKQSIPQKDQFVVYGIGFENNLVNGKKGIAFKEGICPQVIDETQNPNNSTDKPPVYVNKFNCNAKTADLLWQKIESNIELQGSARKFELISAE